MRNNIKKYIGLDIEKLPANSLHWDITSENRTAKQLKLIKSTFYNTTEYRVLNFYKSISKVLPDAKNK